MTRSTLGRPRGRIFLLVGWTIAILTAVASAECPDPEAPQVIEGGHPRSFAVPELGLTGYPAVVYATEREWTFLLRGTPVLSVDAAMLEVEGHSYAMKQLVNLTPRSALIDFEYPLLRLGAEAYLVLMGQGTTLARVPLVVVFGRAVPAERRQADRIRVQLKPGTLLYPLHGFPRDDRQIRDRSVWEVAGDEAFLTQLQETGVVSMRKVLARYAEDDTLHWDPRYHRELTYPLEQLRQYLLVFEPGRSEAAYLEIFRGLERVEAAFINENRTKRSRH